jgi:hypothetical protein
VNAEALMAWLQWCESHPAAWERGEAEIPLAQTGCTFDELESMFDRPTLAEVRQAVEEFIAGGAA